MKITTWNANGLRALYNKDLLGGIQKISPDILCFQEVKAFPEQIPSELKNAYGYFSYWYPAQRPGYSGVAVFSRAEPTKVFYGTGDQRFDPEGRVLELVFPDFHLLNVYFPSGQSGQVRIAYKLDFYSQLLEHCKKVHEDGKSIILTGDFNTAHQEIDLARPKENRQTSGFLPEERVWIDRFLASGFIDAFRWLYPQRSQYTWWTYRLGARGRNIGWRLDYHLVSSNLIDKVQDVTIHDDITGSDHCPVSLILSGN
jgi:exodeoxyribonuclease III